MSSAYVSRVVSFIFVIIFQLILEKIELVSNKQTILHRARRLVKSSRSKWNYLVNVRTVSETIKHFLRKDLQSVISVTSPNPSLRGSVLFGVIFHFSRNLTFRPVLEYHTQDAR